MPKHVRILFCAALLIAIATVSVCSTGIAVEAVRHPDAELPGLEWLAGAGPVLIFTAGLAVLAGALWLTEGPDKR